MGGRGIIYCLENQAMQDFVKIGKTTNLRQRLKQLNNTSVPFPFECLLALEVEDMDRDEGLLHAAYAAFRVSNKEFFEVGKDGKDAVLAAMQLTGGKDVTPDTLDGDTDTETRVVAAKKRGFFRFDDAGISIGAELTYADDEALVARVLKYGGPFAIEFEGEATSLSAAAGTIRERRSESVSARSDGGGGWSIQGPQYWRYADQQHGNETLKERRERMEREGTYGRGVEA